MLPGIKLEAGVSFPLEPKIHSPNNYIFQLINQVS